MSDELTRAIRTECSEDVTRGGYSEPCLKPAVAIRMDPAFGDPYPVCAHHARTADLMIPIATVVAHVVEGIAAELDAKGDEAIDKGYDVLGRGYLVAARIARERVTS